MKYMRTYNKFIAKYGQGTMKVPTGDYEPSEVPPVVEIPPSPKVPAFNDQHDQPSYEDVYVQSDRAKDPEKAIRILIARCEETELFSETDLSDFKRILAFKGPQVAFKEILFQIRKRAFAAETCLQMAKNTASHLL